MTRLSGLGLEIFCCNSAYRLFVRLEHPGRERRDQTFDRVEIGVLPDLIICCVF